MITNSLLIYFFICLYGSKMVESFSECTECGLDDPNIPGVTNCLTWLAYAQSTGVNIQNWCSNPNNYQKCCITCQNYLQLNTCTDIGYKPDCETRARQGLCNEIMTNGVPVKQLCPKSCNNCPGIATSSQFLTCGNLVRNCNSGQCVNVNLYGVPSIQCYCPSSKGGSYCQLNNPCLFNPCNSGQCVPLYENVKLYKCQCPIGLTGNNCEIATPSCNIHCFNGGTCQLGSNNLPSCVCPSMYAGTFCQNFVGQCFSNPCLNGGTCQPTYNGYVCNCQPYYTGRYCTQYISNELCSTGDQNRTLCQSWTSLGLCDFGYFYENIAVPLYCPISCALCNYNFCKDTSDSCLVWSSLNLCPTLINKYPDLCRKTCNNCLMHG